MTHPNHVHPRHKRTVAAAKYAPLHKPLVPIEADASQARKANTYRGHPYYQPQKLPSIRFKWIDRNKYTAEKLREIRAAGGAKR